MYGYNDPVLTLNNPTPRAGPLVTGLARHLPRELPNHDVLEQTQLQGLTLVHLSAQRKRFQWDKGYLGGI